MMASLLILAALSASPVQQAPSAQTQPVSSASSTATTTDPADSEDPQVWLKAMSQALTHDDFVLSLVKVQNGRLQPFRYEHGLVDGKVIEHLVFLNGPPREVVRRGSVVTLLDTEHQPFSYRSDSIRGPIPDALIGPAAALSKYYDLVLAGNSRIAGRSAQLLRIVPKDKYRHGYWIWIDRHSYLPLRVDRVTQRSGVVEQLMVVDMSVTKTPSEHLQKVAKASFPAPASGVVQSDPKALGKVNWLPPGFKPVTANYHHLALLGDGVDYWLFSDGLAEIAVYINPNAPNQELTVHKRGYYNVVGVNHNGIEVMAVGTVPTAALERVAGQVSLRRQQP